MIVFVTRKLTVGLLIGYNLFSDSATTVAQTALHTDTFVVHQFVVDLLYVARTDDKGRVLYYHQEVS